MRTLKNYLMMLLLLPMLAACNQDKIDKLSDQNQQLSAETEELNSQLEDYMKTFNEIEANLEEIKLKEEKINLKTTENVEYADDAKKSIVTDIKAINSLMAENSEKMEALQAKLSNTNAEFKTMVGRLKSRIKEKDEQIIALKTDLEKLNIEKEQLAKNVETLSVKVDTLFTQTAFQETVIDTLQEVIKQQTEELTTAFVAIGTFRDLKNEKIVDKEGGILGLGSVEKLKNDFNKNAFNEINIKEVTSIPLYAREIELVTNHPEDSYEISVNKNEEIEQLMILNPEKFWNSSKYLVVMVN